MPIRVLATRPSKEILALPWDRPLAQWGDRYEVPLARGIHRHVVRFVQLGPEVVVIKETRERYALGEYQMLRNLGRLNLPVVEPWGVVTGREDAGGHPIEPALVTRHLSRSLPYRALFSSHLQDDTLERVIDALVVLLVRLHLDGFFWGDCSLSNTLFRRSAGEFAAYLVDAETGELHDSLTDGQRDHDLDLLRTNVFGELLDLQAGGLIAEDFDGIEVVDRIRERYDELWHELTGVEEFDLDEMWRIEQRIARLNTVGFDVDELDVVTDVGGATVRIQPKVVEAEHHARRLQGLTGLDLDEPQARRLLNDLDAFTAAHELQEQDPMIVAHRWLNEVYRPIEALLPADLRATVETPEAFHQVLEHRWFLSERASHEVSLDDAARDYVATVLPDVASRIRAAETSVD
ncbi:DUF4032 domain-containing protein [Solicola sp. PLA-1-18]|uniref:DUF4032 domain-containing protein n=1 Tax=Solicola sp. PLA-1-18 TaxID=3380532 RepID=UPI003B7A4849